MTAILFFLFALAACVPQDSSADLVRAAAGPDATSHVEAAALWRDFRGATLSNDIERVMRLTKFPFATTGELDDGPITRHDRAAFPALFTRLLRQHERPRPGVSITMRELIRQTPVLREQNFNGEDEHFHVGAFYFGREGERWYLLEAYLAE
ncbi:MAG TPA: hypothetical protein VF613_15220 [Longimicrobium sp.]|jgi:hypothetical protein